MMTPQEWRDKLLEERQELIQAMRSSQIEDTDAYRLLVLEGRLAQLQQLDELKIDVERLPKVEVDSLFDLCASPGDEDLLDDVEQEVLNHEGTEGALLRALLSVDSRATVHELSQRYEEASSLAGNALTQVSLYPERVIGLGSWAEMRLGTLPEKSALAFLWGEVVAAPMRIVEQGVPQQANEITAQKVLKRLLQSRNKVRQFSAKLPERLLALAAQTGELEKQPFYDEQNRLFGYSYSDEGELKVVKELLPEERPARVILRVYDTRADALLLEESVPFEIDGQDLYLSLGKRVGSGSIQEKLLSRARGVPADYIKLQLFLEIDE